MASGAGKIELPELCAKPTSDLEPKEIQGNNEFQAQFSVAANLLNQKFKVNTPDHTWVGDITYLSPMRDGCIWLRSGSVQPRGGRLVYLLQDDPSVGHRCAADGLWPSKSRKGFVTPHGSRQPVCFNRLSEISQRT